MYILCIYLIKYYYICIYIIICYCMSNIWRNYNNHPPKWTYFSLKLAAHHGDDFPGVPSFIPVTSRREVIRWIQWLSLKSELTGGFNLPLWKIWVRQFGFLFPTEWKVIKKNMFQSPPTSEIIFDASSIYTLKVWWVHIIYTWRIQPQRDLRGRHPKKNLNGWLVVMVRCASWNHWFLKPKNRNTCEQTSIFPYPEPKISQYGTPK